MARQDSPFKDVRVRQALNYCIDREGLVALLNGTAEPSVGWLKPNDPDFGNPESIATRSIPPRARRCWPRRATRRQKPLVVQGMISTSGSGQMLPLPMNEFLQENLEGGLRRRRRVRGGRVAGAAERRPRHARRPQLQGAMALNVSSPSIRCRRDGRYFPSANFSPNGFNFEQWKDDEFEDALKTIVGGDRSKAISSRISQGARAARRQPALALHRPRPQSARDEQEGQRVRLAAIVVRRSDAGQPAIAGRVGDAAYRERSRLIHLP